MAKSNASIVAGIMLIICGIAFGVSNRSFLSIWEPPGGKFTVSLWHICLTVTGVDEDCKDTYDYYNDGISTSDNPDCKDYFPKLILAARYSQIAVASLCWFIGIYEIVTGCGRDLNQKVATIFAVIASFIAAASTSLIFSFLYTEPCDKGSIMSPTDDGGTSPMLAYGTFCACGATLLLFIAGCVDCCCSKKPPRRDVAPTLQQPMTTGYVAVAAYGQPAATGYPSTGADGYPSTGASGYPGTTGGPSGYPGTDGGYGGGYPSTYGGEKSGNITVDG